MQRFAFPVAAVALVAAAVAGCSPPTEKSEFNNSGLSVAGAENPAVVPNPPPRIDTPAEATAAPPADSASATANPGVPAAEAAKSDSGIPTAAPSNNDAGAPAAAPPADASSASSQGAPPASTTSR